MKKIMTSIALLVFAGSVNAATDAQIYHGFAKGNPDLETGGSYTYEGSRTAVQPGIGSGSGVMRSRSASDSDIYHGFEQDNPDLYSGSSGYSMAAMPGIGSSSPDPRHSRVTNNDIYHGFEKGNPDLY